MSSGITVVYRNARGIICDRAGVMDVVEKVIERESDYRNMLSNPRLQNLVPALEPAEVSKLTKDNPLVVPDILTITMAARSTQGTPFHEDMPHLTMDDWVSLRRSQDKSPVIQVYTMQDSNAAKRAAQRPAGNGHPVAPNFLKNVPTS